MGFRCPSCRKDFGHDKTAMTAHLSSCDAGKELVVGTLQAAGDVTQLRAFGVDVLYVYKCSECGHRGETHLEGDRHDGTGSKCAICTADVTLEWDGGVVLERLPGNSH